MTLVCWLCSCSSYMYILICTIAGIYNVGWQGPNTRQALKVRRGWGQPVGVCL
jgi:hypothetical protein